MFTRARTFSRRPLAILILLFAASLFAADSSANKLAYPETRKGDQVDVYHGVKVSDPYRWLEDDNSSETRAWVKAENKVTFTYLEQIPERAAIHRRLAELWDYERFGLPRKEGGKYFYAHNSGLQDQSAWYVADSLAADGLLLLDPNQFSADGTVALTTLDFTHDGRLLAYGTASGGSDWQEWHVLDVESGRTLPDHIRWVKFSSASWRKDGKGFFYSRYNEPAEGAVLTGTNYYQKLYYHRLGTPQSEDTLIYERPDDKELGFSGKVTEDGRYLAIQVFRGTHEENGFYYLDLNADEPMVTRLLDKFDAAYDFVGNDGPVFWFRTDQGAARYRVIAIDLDKPEPGQWKEVIPESDDTLQAVTVVGGHLIARYLHDAHSRVKIFTRDGKLVREVSLPGIGTAKGFEGKPDDPETFYSFESFTVPLAIYRYDVATGESSVFRKPSLKFDPEGYQTSQVFYRSKDGTRVPMFLSYKKGLQPDGRLPVLLYGYGGFNIPEVPKFDVQNLMWMELGGVYALANLRGGGEYGREWHEAGMKLHKQNVFDDFIAAAEWLTANQYTASSRLAIHGGSNGGLLVGAVLTQRPDLFGAAWPAVGVMDMLRFNKFTIGWAWVSDYGSAEDPEQFKTLYAYSPLHNIRPGIAYPATLITTADHDDRVVPAHSFKFAAALQAAQAGDEPILIRIETRAGHGAGKPVSKKIEEYGDALAFLVHVLHIEVAADKSTQQSE